MFILTFPCTGVFGNTWTAWIVHFFFVMLVRVVFVMNIEHSGAQTVASLT